ncbi:unnamed protein product, partial [Rotaria magnacalcarata]
MSWPTSYNQQSTDAVSKLSDNAISSLPNLRNLKRNVRKIRQRSQNPLSLPTTRDSIVIDPHHIVPIVYILLRGKKQRLYKEMLQQIKNLIPNFDPPNIMIEHERATMNEIKKQ